MPTWPPGAGSFTRSKRLNAIARNQILPNLCREEILQLIVFPWPVGFHLINDLYHGDLSPFWLEFVAAVAACKQQDQGTG